MEQTLRQTQRTQKTDVTERAGQLGIGPRVLLRPVGEASWDVFLEIPDLTHIMIKFPKAREVLVGSRCVVAGSTRPPIARSGFLHGPKQVRLHEWPPSGNALLSFERSTPEVDAFVETECSLRPGDIWLFRVASDGLAYEVRGRNVRPGQRYVVISTGQPFPQGSVGVPVTVSCAGISAVDLPLDNALNLETTEYLQQLGISQSRGVDVWPAGLAASRWDGEGAAEWLSLEVPCIGIRADHDLEGFGLVLDNDASTRTGGSANFNRSAAVHRVTRIVFGSTRTRYKGHGQRGRWSGRDRPLADLRAGTHTMETRVREPSRDPRCGGPNTAFNGGHVGRQSSD